MKPETYQENAAEWLSRRKVGMVVAPAGSGKTIIAALALSKVIGRKVRDNPVKVGWLANTIEQCEQARKALDLFPEMLPFVDIKIACAAAQTDWSDRDGLIVDENHHSPAEEWRRQIETCKGVRWGFTATPESRDEQRDEVLRQMFWEVFVVERSEVKGRVIGARVIMLGDTDEGVREIIDAEIQRLLPRRTSAMRFVAQKQGRRISDQEIYGQLAWQVCMDNGIVANWNRNNAVLRVAKEHHNDQVLVLVNKIEHGESLAKLIPGACMAFSKMGAKARRESLQRFRDGHLKCLIATSLADEGLDLPNANVLILVSGGRSNARTEQRTGRVLRAFAGKSHGLIYDFHDRWHPLAAKHSRVRQELYRKLGYEVQT